MIHVLSYGDEKFAAALRLHIKTAKKYGAERIYQFSDKDIDECFQEKNSKILSCPRGGGYWLWKPYFINLVIMQYAQNGDWVIYSDAGLIYSHNIKNFVEKLEKQYPGKCFFMKQLKYTEAQYTKRDLFYEMQCDCKEMAESKMYAATVVLIRVCEESRLVVKKWLDIAQNYHFISDEASVTENYPEFMENRHDQSILSLLVKKMQVVINVDDIFIDIIHLRPKDKPLLIYHHSSKGTFFGITIDVFRRAFKYMSHYIER